MTLKPGTLLSKKYRVLRLLGEGGMGYVVAAHDIELDRTVAVKLVRKDTLDSSAIDRLMREARAAAAIDSPHVARVLDFGRTKGGEPFLVLEHLEGTDLAHVGSRSPEEIVGWILQACIGLAAAHGRGIVHRDLKPSNLFLARQPDGTSLVKLLDFGLAKSYEQDDGRVTATGAIIGSPSYMSPEQLSGRELDSRSDIWSLGVTLYELLTGQLPFAAPTTPAICTAVMTAEPLPLRALRPEVPEDLQAIVLECLQKDPKRRPADVAVLAERLERVAPAYTGAAGRARHVFAAASSPKIIVDPVVAQGVPTHLVSSIDTDPADGRRTPRWLFAVAAAGLVGMIGVAVAVLTHQHAPPPMTSTPVVSESGPPTPSVTPSSSATATTSVSSTPAPRPIKPFVRPAAAPHPTPHHSATPYERF